MERKYYICMDFDRKDIHDALVKATFKKMDQEEGKEITYLDLATFVGIRETTVNEEGDKPLNDSELYLVSGAWRWESPNRTAECDIYTKVCGDEVTYRLRLSGYGDYPIGVMAVISRYCKHLVFEAYVSWDGKGEDDPDSDYVYLLNGNIFQSEHLAYLELKVDIATELVNEGKYDLAIPKLEYLADGGHPGAQCNLGVCYDSKGDYELAAKYYRMSSDPQAKINLLDLFRDDKLRYTGQEYLSLCEELIGMEDPIGYVYKSDFIKLGGSGKKDPETAFKILEEGARKLGNPARIIFEMAKMIADGEGAEKDEEKSHGLFGSILGANPAVDFRYGLQCYLGMGCERDKRLGITYLEKALESDYMGAAEVLHDIYTRDKELKNEALASKYRSILDKAGLMD